MKPKKNGCPVVAEIYKLIFLMLYFFNFKFFPKDLIHSM